MAVGALGGVSLVSFEARRSEALARLFSQHGARVLRSPESRATPTPRDLPAPDSPDAGQLLRDLRTGRIEAVFLLTGVGTRALAAAVQRTAPDFPTLLARTLVVAAPKATLALRELGVAGFEPMPPPCTWRESLAVLDRRGLPAGAAVAVEQYGQEPATLLLGLEARGHDVLRVRIHRWELPDDVAPLQHGIGALLARQARIAVFTSPAQVEHLFRVAPDADALREALANVIVACVDAACAETLEAYGVVPTLEADTPGMRPLVHLVADRAPSLLCRG